MSFPVLVRQPVVWLVNEGGHNYQKADRWGRLMPLTKGSVNPFATDRLLVNLSQRLSVAQEADFIAISGIAILNALVIAIMLAKFDKVNILQWSSTKSSYVKLVWHKATINTHANTPQGPAE